MGPPAPGLNPDLSAPEPDAAPAPPLASELRSFGVGLAAILCLWGWLRARSGHAAAPWLGGAGLAAALALAWPSAYSTVYGPWMRLVGVLARANLWVLSALLYYGVFTPYAAALRLLGKDLLDARLRTGDSYWVKREPDDDPGRYRRQY